LGISKNRRGRDGKCMYKRDETYGRPVHRRKDNIKMVLSKIGFYGINWIHIHDRSELSVLEDSLMNFHLPQNAGNLLTT
jgi:hypothetical protein